MKNVFNDRCKTTRRLRTPLLRLKTIAVWLAVFAGNSATGSALAEPLKVPDTIAQRVLACAACHGKDGRAASEGNFPRIAGKPAGYLYEQLLSFRDGRRQNPMMTYMVAHMSDDYLKEISEYFSGLKLPYPSPQPANVAADILERGRVLVVSGDAARNIPACIACHGQKLTGVLPAIPSLIGLPRDYLNSQFGAWKNGARKALSPDCMAQISKRLRPEDVAAVSAWLASRPIPQDMTPELALPAALPMPCGSAPK